MFVCLTSVILAGIAFRQSLKEGGLLQLTGDKAALDGGTPVGLRACLFVSPRRSWQESHLDIGSKKGACCN